MSDHGTTGRDRRTRVAVLGGGPAALTAAFELTATPELRSRYEVTVHQLGWRLGGKGASGRNPARGQRIEEHGLHLWFGFYDNAFSMMRRCYAELGRPPGAPLAKWTDAFKPHDSCVQYEQFRGQWIPHRFGFPPNALTPGDPHEVGLWEVVHQTARFLEDEWSRLRDQHHAAVTAAAAHSTPDVNHNRLLELARRLEVDFDDWKRTPAVHLLHLTRALAQRGDDLPGDALAIVAHLLCATRDWIWRDIVKERVDDAGLRMFFMKLDLAAAMVSGISEDRLRERDFGAINDEDLRAWLRRHGASDLSVDCSPLVRAVYDAAFCFEEGDVLRPNIAAGKAMQDIIRSIFQYKGAPFYKMQAGMGDTVFGPLYEVLHRRGVRFEFFNCVTRLRTSADGRTIDTIEIVPQATVRGGGEYKPLVDVKGLQCWPSRPDWSQLEHGDELRHRHVDFERHPNPLGNKPIRRRRGRDFDEVVLGIPVGALRPICGELAAANHAFAAMLDNAHTVMTQAFQVWMKRDAAGLGFPHPPGTLVVSFVEPVDTSCDMSQVLPCEEWPEEDDVRLVAYFCGVLPEKAARTQEEADAHVREAALGYLRGDVETLWPKFDWDLLVDPHGAKGEARFDRQYWRANFSGTERYALTLAGSMRYRLWPDQSGFENLALAGDWTRNGIDGGSVEAAVTSGMLASQKICGEPAEVPGTTGWLESDKQRVIA